jgi:N-acetyl-gamma-glutamyl-phosphate reductase
MTAITNGVRVGILGASGYTGAELVRLLVRHPGVEIVLLTAERHADQPIGAVFPHLGGLGLPDLVSIDEVEWPGLDVDVMFCALPHGTTQEIVAGLMHATGHTLVDELVVETRADLIAGLKAEGKVIDLSADFRLTDTAVYAEWYGHEHLAPSLQEAAVYGLTEFAREAIGEARLIACPGCYPTAALVPLVPLLEAGQIAAEDIIIDAKSGVSGAGRALKEGILFAEVGEGIHAYGIAAHRHGPEIEQELSRAAGQPMTVNFTPHLVPMNRGILATTYVRLADGASVQDLRATLEGRFQDEPFVRVLAEGVAPATRHVRGSNHCLIGVFADRLPGRAILISAIDNLVKGASGQAVQNMNLACGFPEVTGLEQAPMFP